MCGRQGATALVDVHLRDVDLLLETGDDLGVLGENARGQTALGVLELLERTVQALDDLDVSENN